MISDSAAGPSAFSRRTLLRGVAATAVLGGGLTLAGCGSGPPPTVATLTAEQPFYIAHRGGGGDWPEMTAYAYAQSAKIKGLHALEMSVCISSDGVLVCSHDPDTLRVTGVDLTIAQQTWSTLSALKVTAATTDDPGQPSQPLTRFDEVVERYIGRYVIFAEPKVPEAADALMAKLVSLKSPERVVWKQYVTSPHWQTAKQNGFATWGYLLDQQSHLGNLDRWATDPQIDLLGIGIEQTDQVISSVVTAGRAAGKKTIAWPVGSTGSRDRAVGLGVSGMMVSNVAEIVPNG